MFRYTLLLSIILHAIIIWGVGWYNLPEFSVPQQRTNYFQVTVVTTPSLKPAGSESVETKSFKTINKTSATVNKSKTAVTKLIEPSEKQVITEPSTVSSGEETPLSVSTMPEMNLTETSSLVPTETSILDRSELGKTGQNSDGSVEGRGLIPVTQGPQQNYTPQPQYPRLARRKGWEGTIVLRIEVLTNGTIGRIELDRSTGYQILDEAAIKAVKQWRYTPALSGDNPVTCWVKTPIRFQLE